MGEYVIGAAIGREATIGALAIVGVALMKLAVSGLEAVTVPGRTEPSMGVAPKPYAGGAPKEYPGYAMSRLGAGAANHSSKEMAAEAKAEGNRRTLFSKTVGIRNHDSIHSFIRLPKRGV